MPLPTYAELIPAILQWAADRELLHPYGTAYLATTERQHDKTCEEIEEASLELRKLAKTKALAERLFTMGTPGLIYDAVAILARRRNALALEFGDVLVTLCIQSSIQGVDFEYCCSQSGCISNPVQTWPYVDCHARGLGVAIDNYSKRTPAFIGVVARCVEDTARIELSLTGPECLALALAKISGRQGEVVDGVFVKAGVRANR